MKNGIMIPVQYNENTPVYFILAGNDYYFEAQSFFEVLGLLKDNQTVSDVCMEYGIKLQDIEVYNNRYSKEKGATPSMSESVFEQLLLLIYENDCQEKKKFIDWYFDTLLPSMDSALNMIHSSDRALSKKLILDGGFIFSDPLFPSQLSKFAMRCMKQEDSYES